MMPPPSYLNSVTALIDGDVAGTAQDTYCTTYYYYVLRCIFYYYVYIVYISWVSLEDDH